MKASEFVKQYCEKAGWTEKAFYESQVPMPDSSSPSGWAAVTNSPTHIKAHVDLHMGMPGAASEPVYQVFSFKHWRDVSKDVFEAQTKDGCPGRVLYSAPPAPTLSIDKVKLGEWLDSEVGGVRPEQYDFYLKSFYENVMPAPVAVHDAIRLLQSEITIWKDRWEGLRVLFREVADALGCDVKDNAAMIDKIAKLQQKSSLSVPDDVIKRLAFDLVILGSREELMKEENEKHLFELVTIGIEIARAVLQNGAACTCPSGDGSLRWPCPVHQPETATADEKRQLRDLVMMVKMLCRTVKKYNATSQQAKDYTEYLQREGLISATDCLRVVAKDAE